MVLPLRLIRSHCPAPRPRSETAICAAVPLVFRCTSTPPLVRSARMPAKTAGAPGSVSLARTMRPAVLSGLASCKLRMRATTSKSPLTFRLTK